MYLNITIKKFNPIRHDMNIKINLNLKPNTRKLTICIRLFWVTSNSKNKFYGINLVYYVSLLLDYYMETREVDIYLQAETTDMSVCICIIKSISVKRNILFVFLNNCL